MKSSKIGSYRGSLLEHNRSLIATPVAVLLFFLVLSTSAVADIINVTVNFNGTGAGSVTPGLPPFFLNQSLGLGPPFICGACGPGIHTGGTSFFLDLAETTLMNTYQGHLNFTGPNTWDQPAGDPGSPLIVPFPVTFDGSFSSLGGTPTHLVGSGTGSILLSIVPPGSGGVRLWQQSTYTVGAAVVPEPGTLLLLAAGGVIFLWPKRRNASTT